MPVTLAVILVAFISVGMAGTSGEGWPQWLGPNRDGISPEPARAPLARTPKPVWRVSVGVGVSSFVVGDGRALTMGHVRGPQGRGMDTVYCLDAETGSVIWTHAYDCLSCRSQDVRFYGPRATPTIDGDRVFTLSLEGHLFCFEADSGKVLWTKDLPRDLGGRIPLYGYCCSPLVYGESLVLELNAKDASYIALDKSAGDTIWKLAGGDVTCGSPVLTQIDGTDCLVFMGGGSVVGVDAQSGSQRWKHPTWGHAWMGPVVSGNNIFVANASLPRGCGLIRVEAGKPRVVWEDRARKFQTLHCNSVIWRGHIYGFDNTGTDYQGKDSRKSALKCLSLDTGDVKWSQSGMGWGNLIVHDEKLLILRETGEVVVARAWPERYEELARTTVCGSPSWTVPAIVNGKLYCRNNGGDAVCLQLFGNSRDSAQPPAPTVRPPQPRTLQPRDPSVVQPAIEKQQAAASPSAFRDEWPRFRGPGGLGIAFRDGAARPKEIIWKSPVPLEGESSPIIRGSRVFLTGAGQGRTEVYCFEGESGRLLWQTEVTVPDGRDAREAGDILLAAATPVTDGNCVYTIFGNGDVACLDLEGEVKWSCSLGVPEDDYGHATSLDVWENLLLVQLDQGQAEDGKSALLALDSDTGRTVWETARAVPCSWSTPILIDVAGRPQLITCAEPWAIAYEPATGREIWRADCLSGQIVPSPVYVNGLLYVVSPDGRLAAIRPDGHGDVTRTHPVWMTDGTLPSICSPVCNGELLWLLDTGGILTCCDAMTGMKLWEKDLGASFQASPTVEGGLLYLLSDGGTLFLVEASRQYRLAGRVELGEDCQASPAIRQGRMYIRSKRHLVCLGETAGH